MIVFDASVPIAHLSSAEVQHRRASSLFARVVDEEFRASPLTLAEVLVAPARAGVVDQASALLAQLGIRSVDLTEMSPTHLATLRVETGLRLPDCCVLLAAEQTGSALATFDARLAAGARARDVRVAG